MTLTVTCHIGIYSGKSVTSYITAPEPIDVDVTALMKVLVPVKFVKILIFVNTCSMNTNDAIVSCTPCLKRFFNPTKNEAM